jgi:hypothetical protein
MDPLQKAMHDGGPAFPTLVSHPMERGMSLRDWFAGQVMIGAMTNIELMHEAQKIVGKKGTLQAFVADYCYTFADALLAEKAK